MKIMILIMCLFVPLREGQIVHNLHTKQAGKIIRIEPGEVLVKSGCKRLYWSKYELKEWKW